jgi:hypothetical protein
MIPTTAAPYAAGVGPVLALPLIVAIAGGVVLVGVSASQIADYDPDDPYYQSPVSP